MAPSWRKEFGSAEKMLSMLNRTELIMVMPFSINAVCIRAYFIVYMHNQRVGRSFTTATAPCY